MQAQLPSTDENKKWPVLRLKSPNAKASNPIIGPPASAPCCFRFYVITIISRPSTAQAEATSCCAENRARGPPRPGRAGSALKRARAFASDPGFGCPTLAVRGQSAFCWRSLLFAGRRLTRAARGLPASAVRHCSCSCKPGTPTRDHHIRLFTEFGKPSAGQVAFDLQICSKNGLWRSSRVRPRSSDESRRGRQTERESESKQQRIQTGYVKLYSY